MQGTSLCKDDIDRSCIFEEKKSSNGKERNIKLKVLLIIDNMNDLGASVLGVSAAGLIIYGWKPKHVMVYFSKAQPHMRRAKSKALFGKMVFNFRITFLKEKNYH